MKIAALNTQDNSKFNELARSHGTVFSTNEWTNLFDKSINRYGIYNKNDELIGGFILYSESKFGLSLYRNPPFTPSIGPFLKVDSNNPVSIMDTWKRALSVMADFIDNVNYSAIFICLDKYISDTQPFIWNKYKVIPSYTYVVDLSIPEKDLLKRMSNERRKNINKGLKDGLKVSKINNFEIVRSLVLKTYSRQEKKANSFYLNKVLFEYANQNNSFAYATYHNDKPIACSFCIHDNKTAYYLVGGYDHENKHHGAGAMSMWRAIRYAQEKELHYFDFEGSMNQNIERYFRGFGGQLTPFYRINKAMFPVEIILKYFKREWF